MNEKVSKQELNDMLKKAGDKLSASPEQLKNLADKSPEELMGKLKPEDAAKLNQIMNNPELADRLMNTPQAKMLMKLLMGK